MLRTTLLLFAVLGASLVAGQSVSTVAFSESKGIVHAFSESGEVTLEMACVQVDIVHAAGKQERGNMVVVYDRQGGFYYWHLNPAHDAQDTMNLSPSLTAGSDALYVSPAGLVEFAMPGGFLGVLERSQRANSVNAAQVAAIEEIRQGLPVFEGRGYDPGYKQLELGRQIGRHWACKDSGDADIDPLCTFHVNRFASISREGGNWRVVAQNRWDQEIILDSKFNLVSTRRVPLPGK